MADVRPARAEADVRPVRPEDHPLRSAAYQGLEQRPRVVVVGEALRYPADGKLDPEIALGEEAEKLLESRIGDPTGGIHLAHVVDDERNAVGHELRQDI